MNIKGKTTIQLFDDQNQLKQEIVEENIITNAVQKIVTLEGKEYFNGLRFNPVAVPYYHLSGITPISTELFGGVLLFEDAIPENASTIYPPAEAKPVGHAGVPYAGGNPYRGTHNDAESGPLYSGTTPIGYRHVWDFATDRCNGKIGSICLTSKAGGNTGWKARGASSAVHNTNAFDADAYSYTYLCGGNSINVKTFSGANNGRSSALIPTMTTRNQQVGRVIYLNDATGEFFFMSNSGAVYKGEMPPSITIGLDTVFSPQNPTVPLTQLFEVNSILNLRTFISYDAFSQTFTAVVPVSSTRLEKRIYNHSGLISTTSIVLSGTTLYSWNGSPVPPFEYHGYYFATITASDGSVQLGKLDNTGSLIQTFDWSPYTRNTFTCVYSAYMDRVSLKSRYQASDLYGVELFFNGTTFEPFRHADAGNSDDYYEVATQDNSVPGFYYSISRYTNTGYVTELYFCFRTNYLASINNLSNPVVKTSANTMKITYDIYVE